MEPLLALMNIVLGGIIVAVVATQAKHGTVPLLSARNFFLMGVMLFQVISATVSFATQDYWEAYLGNPGRTGLIFTGALSLFLVLFHIVYTRGWFTFNLPVKLMTRFRVPSESTILGLSIAMGVLGLVCRFGLIYIPVFGVLAGMLANLFSSASAALLCWNWAKRLANPVYITAGVFILGAAFVVATYHAYGRRDLLTLMAACLFSAYRSHFRYLPLRKSLVPLGAIAAVGVLLLAAFTAARSAENAELSQKEMNSRMANADLKAGLLDLLSGQYAAACSMWLVESRPNSYPYNTLHSLRYAVTNIIPREYYPGDKPTGLGLTMVPEASMNINRGDTFSVGPGLVGHIFNDNPWIALPLYALLLGAIMHICDKLLVLQPDNPFIVIPVSCALGEFIAIPRGEMGLYSFRSVFGIGAVYVGMAVMAKVMMGSGWKYVPADEAEPGYAPEAYDDGADPAYD